MKITYISTICTSLCAMLLCCMPAGATLQSESYDDKELECEDYDFIRLHPSFAPPVYSYFGGRCLNGCLKTGVWLPDGPPIFRPFIADPRQVCFSASWRFNDQALTKNVIPVSYGGIFPIYRWFNVQIGPLCGTMEFDIEGALWAVFDPGTVSAPLMNADYYVGFPLSYSFGPWAFRLRGYHISSHIGDEFLLNHPHFDRRNPSAEYLDLFGSYMISKQLRLYAGLGYVLEQDESFPCKRFYAEGGVEVRLYELGFHSWCNNISGRPIFAIHCRHKGDYENHVDLTYALGYEWAKTRGQGRRVRLYMEYHDGYSVEGQFCRIATNYLSLRLTYGF